MYIIAALFLLLFFIYIFKNSHNFLHFFSTIIGLTEQEMCLRDFRVHCHLINSFDVIVQGLLIYSML